MKTIYFMRHAKSDWSFDVPDIERPLNSRGMNNAPQMGEELKRRDEIPQLIISSPAVRAFTTANLFGENVGYNAEIIKNDDFYFGSLWDVVDCVMKLSDRLESVMVVGHNPTWENLVSNFITNFNPPKFPTGAIAKVTFDVQSWKDISAKSAELEWYITPKSLS